MSQLNSLVLISALVIVCASRADVAQPTSKIPKDDTQEWNDIQLAAPLSKKVDFVLQGTVRLGDDVTRPVDERLGVGFVFKVNKHLSLNPFFFHRDARRPNGTPESEDRVTLGATWRFPIRKFSFVERNWIERRWRRPQVDAWRYRIRLQLEHPFKINKAKFTGYVSDEVFYDWSQHDWVRNRLSVGASHAFNEHFTGDLYFMRQNDGRSRPGDITILGSQLKFKM